MIRATLDLFQYDQSVSVDEFLPFAGQQIHQFCQQELFFDFECFKRNGTIESLWALWDLDGNREIDNSEYKAAWKSIDLNDDGTTTDLEV